MTELPDNQKSMNIEKQPGGQNTRDGKGRKGQFGGAGDSPLIKK